MGNSSNPNSNIGWQVFEEGVHMLFKWITLEWKESNRFIRRISQIHITSCFTTRSWRKPREQICEICLAKLDNLCVMDLIWSLQIILNLYNKY